MTTFRAMKIDDFGNSVFYRISCSCGESEDDLIVEFEKDPEVPGEIFINFYKDLSWSSNWGDYNFFSKMWRRVKAALRILFTGYIEVEQSFIVEGEEHIDSFIKALEEGKQLIKEK